MRGKNDYPEDWKAIAKRVKGEAGWKCVRCGRAHSTIHPGEILTVHHVNGDKADCRWWNLAALCQRCHLSVQARIDLDRPWVFEHSAWFRPYVAGHYALRYLGEDLSRAEVEGRLEELLALEARAVLGTGPIPLGVTS